MNEFYQKFYLPYIKKHQKGWKKVDIFFKKWILPSLGKTKLNKISVKDIEKLKNLLMENQKSLRTVQHVLSLLKACLNRARKWGIFSGENPVSMVEVPRFDNKRIRFLSYEEAAMLLEECKKRTTERNLIYPMVLLALTTGMRAGEIFRLKVQDVDFEEGVIHVKDTKSGYNRIVYLTKETKKELLKLTKDKPKGAYVFTNPEGKPFTSVPEVWKSVVKSLGLNDGISDPREKVVFHTLRHTFCSWLAMEGVPLHVIKELAGHRTIQMTERYAHLLPDVRRKAVEKVEELLKRKD